MYYVYVLQRKRNDEFYIGYTNNLERRLKEHRKEGNFKLVYYEAYQLEKVARQREKKLKYYGSAWRALKKRITA
ncbi:MAG: excinuclease ABC subunit C [Parcubacteria group bacterium CG11_big_fil_rev_8_21_14_0_20_39_14]|nr:MAG: excinuclease ABC subunit C [Parcubacteria group bacterium CG11_big_fil_rev_8_21_14_0_20_39_14]